MPPAWHKAWEGGKTQRSDGSGRHGKTLALPKKTKARLQVAAVTGPSLLLTPGFPQLSYHLFLEQEEHVVLPEPDAGLQPSSCFLRLPGEWRQWGLLPPSLKVQHGVLQKQRMPPHRDDKVTPFTSPSPPPLSPTKTSLLCLGQMLNSPTAQTASWILPSCSAPVSWPTGPPAWIPHSATSCPWSSSQHTFSCSERGNKGLFCPPQHYITSTELYVQVVGSRQEHFESGAEIRRGGVKTTT